MKEKRYPPHFNGWEPRKPTRLSFIGFGAIKKTSIYHDTEILMEDWDAEEYYKGMGEEPPEEPLISYNKLTLQDLVDLAPPGAKLSDITFDISYPRMLEYLDISFYHQERLLELEEQAYQKALQDYDVAFAKYQEACNKHQAELADYQAWKKQQDIIDLEEKLAQLKK